MRQPGWVPSWASGFLLVNPFPCCLSLVGGHIILPTASVVTSSWAPSFFPLEWYIRLRVISPCQDLELNHICIVLLPYKIRYSQVHGHLLITNKCEYSYILLPSSVFIWCARCIMCGGYAILSSKFWRNLNSVMYLAPRVWTRLWICHIGSPHLIWDQVSACNFLIGSRVV